MMNITQRVKLAHKQMVIDFQGSRLNDLSDCPLKLEREGKALLFDKDKLELYLFFRGLWRRKIRISYPENAKAELRQEKLHIITNYSEDIYSLQKDGVSGEIWFLKESIFRNAGNCEKEICPSSQLTYFMEGPLADFAYASYKHICRGMNMESYPYPEIADLHLSDGANNQLFYISSGGLYTGTAWLDRANGWISKPERDEALRMTHEFQSCTKHTLKPGEEITYSFAFFAGIGPEEHIGTLSDILWRHNNAPMHLPQTDMRRFLNNYVSVWPKAELCGKKEGDHYAAHFFVDFYGNFPEGYYPPDQFGCSWLAYDLLKADYFCRLYDRTGNREYLEKTAKIVDFYCFDHFIGNSHLTYPFHTGEFMKTCPPYCEKAGWGAPLDAGVIDSLAQSEMIFDALSIYRRHPELFPKDYIKNVAGDVLKLQQADGHFRRRYNASLEPEAKPGWIDQNYESQSWIPAILLLAELGGGEACREAAIRCGEAALFDLEIKGLFAMGGSETDYPTLWDIDGYRSMLRAMLALYETLGEKRWLNAAEKVQALSNAMMCSYNVPIPEGTFYNRIGWRCKGMIATSFYNRPDYLRSFSTPTGNQSVCWVGYLLLQLYRATGKRIYAERGIAAIRQVMIYRDEESLRGKPYMKNLLYTIFENNPQIGDVGGGYQAGVAQDGYSMFIDLYLYLDNVLEEFGDVYCDLEHEELLGINCFQCKQVDFSSGKAIVVNEMNFDREFTVNCSDGRRMNYTVAANGEAEIRWKE